MHSLVILGDGEGECAFELIHVTRLPDLNALWTLSLLFRQYIPISTILHFLEAFSQNYTWGSGISRRFQSHSQAFHDTECKLVFGAPLILPHSLFSNKFPISNSHVYPQPHIISKPPTSPLSFPTSSSQTLPPTPSQSNSHHPPKFPDSV
jgi:hypothetical protein